MGGDPTVRLRWKEPLHSLEVELLREYGLSPVSARALVLRLGEFLEASAGPGTRAPGQLQYLAVAAGEPAGKPLRLTLTVPVALTLLHGEDAEVLHDSGSPALRRARLARLCAEAHRQGGLLSHEDLALLLALDLSTVRRLVRACAEEGERPPTRGLVQDIGPTLSHKEQVLRLYFRGLLPARIAARTGHSLGSVERYLHDFARVVQLHANGVELQAIARITGLSPRLVSAYDALARGYDSAAHRPVLDRLLRRFGAFDLHGDGEEDHG